MWNYVLTGENEIDFDSELLESIREKRNDQVQATLQNAKNLCTAVDFAGASLLHYAAEYANETISRFLLKSGAKVDLQNEEGQTPLILATKGEHEETIRVLLDHDADIYLVDNDGVSAVQVAVQGNLAEMFLARLKSDCCESDEMAKRLLKVNCPLYVAVRLRDTGLVKYMLSEGSLIDAADPKFNRTALHVAVRNRLLEMVKLLVDRGANVNALDVRNQTPLSLMRIYRKTDILEILVNGKTDLTACTEDGFMQVHWVLTKGNCEAVKIIARSGLDLQSSDSHERTVVHYLASNMNKGIVGALKQWIGENNTESDSVNPKKEIDWNARDKGGLTALHYAVSVGNANFARYLIEKGANINSVSIAGLTPFLQAIDSTSESTLKQRVACVKILLMNGAHPDVLMRHFFKCHDKKPAIEQNYDLLEPVIVHLALWNALDKPFDQETLPKIESYPRLTSFFDKCMNELEAMESEELFDSVTLFDVVAGNDKAVEYLKGCQGPCVKRRIRRCKWVSIYGRVLDCQVDKLTSTNTKNDINSTFVLLILIMILAVALGLLISRLILMMLRS